MSPLIECFEIAGCARISVDDELCCTDLELIIRWIFMYKDHSELCLKSDIDVLISTKNLEDIVKFHQGIENLNCRTVEGQGFRCPCYRSATCCR